MSDETERPEERDSLAEIEERLVECLHSGDADSLEQAEADLRTLINEVKGYRQAEATLNRVDEVRTEKLRALEAEVKGLREENETLQKRLLGTSR